VFATLSATVSATWFTTPPASLMSLTTLAQAAGDEGIDQGTFILVVALVLGIALANTLTHKRSG
jgi:hypothetical protein